MNTLANVRAELDAIDDALHDLLMRRADVVAGLASSRAKAGGPTLRPGREARILRRLLGRHSGPLPRAALVRLWREMFATSIRQQNSFSLALHGVGDSVPKLVAEHFGMGMPTRSYSTPSQALAAVGNGDAAIAVLPFPSEADPAELEWWPALDAPRLAVVARLPFYAEGNPGPEALIVAHGMPDASDDDRSLLLVEADPELSRGAVLQGLAEAGITARLLIVRRNAGLSRFLFEADGLIEPGDARLAAPNFIRTRLLGAYATPIRGISA